MNRVILVNTFLNFTSLRFSISSEQLLLGTPPREITLQQKYPTPSIQVLSSTSKTGLCSFLRNSTAECEIELQLRLWFLMLRSPLQKQLRLENSHFCLPNIQFVNPELVERPYTYTLVVYVLYQQMIVSSVSTLFPFLLKRTSEGGKLLTC